MTSGVRVYVNRHSEPYTLIIRNEPYMYVCERQLRFIQLIVRSTADKS